MCLSFTTQVLYSFCSTEVSCRGCTPPWQLGELQEPGPVNIGSKAFPGSTVSALKRPPAANTAAHVTMARHLTTAVRLITVVPATIMAADRLTRITATTQAGRTPIGVTELPGDITHTRMGAVIPTATTTTTTRTTHQLMAITHRWLSLFSSASANLVIIMAGSMELWDRERDRPSQLLRAGMA